MPAAISFADLGLDKVRKEELSRRLKEVFDKYERDWGVKIIGSTQNDIWEMTITNPEGNRIGRKKLDGLAGEQTAQSIIVDVEHIMRDEKEKA